MALDNKQQSIVTISAFTAKGDLVQLQKALTDGLDAGLTIHELKEVIVQLYAYAGFPRSLNAISTLEKVLNERKLKGIKDIQGRGPSKVVSTKSKFEIGKDVQTKLTGSTATGAPQRFVPVIDTFLKEHLFADIFSRDVLDWKTREIVTISALTSLSGVESQLGAHFNVGLNTGLTETQLKSIVSIIQSKVGPKEGNAASRVLQGVLKQRGFPADSNSTKQIAANDQSPETLFPTGQQITNNNFTGNAWLQMMVATDSSNSIQVGNVTFEPGARSNWHIHPAGQILLVTDGVGYYQEKGSPKRVLRKGDVVKCPPNIPHWHGASRDQKFIQVAITNTQNGPPVWLQAVTDEEYDHK